jgi:hypothetical protein
MIWVIYAIVVLTIVILLVKWDNFKKLWLAGVIGVVVAVLFDAPLVAGGLYEFQNIGIGFMDLPVFYLISTFAGGIFIVHFYPWGNIVKGLLFYILSSVIFMTLEALVDLIGIFEHISWSYVNSFFINIIGFIITTYVYMLIKYLIGNKENLKF